MNKISWWSIFFIIWALVCALVQINIKMFPTDDTVLSETQYIFFSDCLYWWLVWKSTRNVSGVDGLCVFLLSDGLSSGGPAGQIKWPLTPSQAPLSFTYAALMTPSNLFMYSGANKALSLISVRETANSKTMLFGCCFESIYCLFI